MSYRTLFFCNNPAHPDDLENLHCNVELDCSNCNRPVQPNVSVFQRKLCSRKQTCPLDNPHYFRTAPFPTVQPIRMIRIFCNKKNVEPDCSNCKKPVQPYDSIPDNCLLCDKPSHDTHCFRTLLFGTDLFISMILMVRKRENQ